MGSTGTTSSSSPLPLEGRVAIITGASRGIGREISLHLASLGAKVVLSYTSVASAALANLLARKINASSPPPNARAITYQANVSDPLQVKLLFDRAQEAFQTEPHIVVNSAGVLDHKYPTIANTSVDDFDYTFNVNTRGAFLVSREAANRLKRGGGGRIILLSSSDGGLRVGFGAYAASKAAIETMVKILARELKGMQITANCVAPGPIATQMFFEGKTEDQIEKTIEKCPMGRLGEIEDIAPVVGFLAGDGSEWINGQTIRVNGGSALSKL
ncbi:3-oxoacyl-[acyl-carrier-protein] reductase [Ranunculus cassubicifolius]